MSVAWSYVDAGLAVLKRDAFLYLSYRARFVAQLLSIFLSMALFYYISKLVRIDQFPKPSDYFAYVVIGLAAIEVLTASLQTVPITLRGELVAGTFERLAVSAFGPVASILAMAVFPVAASLLTATLNVAVAALVFGVDIEWSTAALAFPVALLGALALLPFVLVLCAIIIVAKQAGGGVGFVVTGLSLVGGAFFPAELLPGWIEWMSGVQPFTPALELMRSVVLGASLEQPAWVSIGRLLIFATVLIPIAVWSLSRSIRWARRRGTLIEY